MKRVIKSLIVIVVLVIVFCFAGEFALNTWIGHKKNDEAHSMHEGHVIVDEIRARDPMVKVTWTNTDDGQPDIIVRNVFDVNKQDEIIAWARAVKQQVRVDRRITIDFQKEIPHGDDVILRTVEF